MDISRNVVLLKWYYVREIHILSTQTLQVLIKTVFYHIS